MKKFTKNLTNALVGNAHQPRMIRGFVGAFITATVILTIFLVGCGNWDEKSITSPSDAIAPTVSSIEPANNATGVALNKKIAATFSEAMDPLTITTTTFTIKNGATSVSGTVSYVGLVATFTPSSDLTANTTYTATIMTGAEDLAGNELENEYSWTFITGAAPDTNPPTVSSIEPVNNATGVALNKKIAATFSEAMDPLTITTTTFTIKNGATSVSGTVSYVGLVATFTPSSDLTANTTYIATITTGAEDLAGNELENDFGWTFITGTTPDTTPPTVSSIDPANNATSVALNKKPTATFSEAMDPSTLTTATVTLKQGATVISGTVTYSGTSVTFTPAVNLSPNSVYSVMIATGAKDLAGNALTSSYGWSFTTGIVLDTTSPTVSSTDPANNATGVALNKKPTATFSEAMDPLTLTTTTVILKQGANVISGTVIYVGTNVTFTPAVNLSSSTLYTATITTGAKDLVGNALADEYTWNFTTGTASDNTPPTVISTDPANNATGVALNKKPTATFSEAMDPLTLTTTTVTLKQGITVISGTVTYAGTSITFTPTVNLSYNTTYAVTITTGAKDLAGNALADEFAWNFTTGVASDITPPTVISTDPEDNDIDVALNKKPTATFSEAMDPSTLTTATVSLKQGATVISGTVNYAGTSVTFTPSEDFAYNTIYTVTLTTGAKDLAGNALADEYVWIFTTGTAPDNMPPTVISTDPEDNDIDVALNKIISATFSEEMNPLTISTETVSVTGLTEVIGDVNYDNLTNTVTFIPSADLASGTTYNVKIFKEVEDLAGNKMLNDKTWSFSTADSISGQTPIPLGTSARFAILSNSAITNISTSSITGDVGISPGARASIAGLTNPEVHDGEIYAADDAAPVPAMLIAAKTDAENAYLNAVAAVRGTPTPISGNINGLTFVPGLYESGSSIEISSDGRLYLDAQGDENAVFVIRSATSITTEATSEVVLTGGAKAQNIFWTAGSSITLGTDSKMSGTLIASTSISLLTHARLDGRALIQSAAAGQVSLDQCTIVLP